jgi:enamine deaminase RidA (YjgF/YER057c/UK114 family)
VPRRESIYLEGFAHANPVPAACRIGPYLQTGVITGRDPETHEMPESLDAQIVNVFAHVRELMSVAGGSTDDILKMVFHLASYRDREALNREWTAMFPDPADRPTRQVMAATLDGASLVQAELIAILDERSR